MAFQDLDFVFTVIATGAAQTYKGGPGVLQITAGSWSTGKANPQISTDGGTRYVSMKDIAGNAIFEVVADAMYNVNLPPCQVRVNVVTATITTGQVTLDSIRNVNEKS